VSRRGVRVIELQDFMCRCGGTDLERREQDGEAVELRCSGCGRRYAVRRLTRQTRISNLPMSFGFRSLYWDSINVSGGSIEGVTEDGFEIREIEGEGSR
jgi:hypothetical protein